MTFDWFEIKDKLNYYSLILISFFIPLSKEVIVPLILLFVLTSFFVKKESKVKRSNNLLLFISGFYVLGATSLIYTNNMSATLFNLEIKFSLLLFPLVFFLGKLNMKQSFPFVLKSFIDGCLAATIINFLIAFLNYYLEGDFNSFFYTRLSYFSHVSYFSMYLCFSISILYFFLYYPTKLNYIGAKKSILLIVVFSIAVLFSVSKSGILTLLIVHFIAILYWIKKHRKIKQGILIFFSIVFALIFSYKVSSNISQRINGLVFSIAKTNEDPTTSTQMRYAAWEVALSLSLNSPIIGYGVGDVTSNMVRKYKVNNYKKLVKKELNTHNQYLQILVGSGIIGLVYFLYMLYLPIRKTEQKTFLLYLLFLIIIMVNFMTESMLERQSGVVFFAFFITLFYSILPIKQIS